MVEEIPQFTGYVTNGIVNITDVTLSAYGCEDQSACNASPLFDFDNFDNINYTSNCIYAEEFYSCNGNCYNDTDGDGVCDENEILGCQNQLYLEFDADATDPGECMTLIVYGCMSPNAINYSASANVSDGSCIIYGCTQYWADNYDYSATYDNGSCC